MPSRHPSADQPERRERPHRLLGTPQLAASLRSPVLTSPTATHVRWWVRDRQDLCL